MTARIAKVTSINATAQVPGEFSGPAVAVSLVITNGRATPIAVGSSVVNLYYGGAARTPADPVSGPPNSPLTGSIAPGASQTTTYVFTLPVKDRSAVTIEVSYSPTQPVVLFTGSVG